MKSTRLGNEDLGYVDSRARRKEASRLQKKCPHNNGKRLDGNLFRCIDCGEPRGFFRIPKGRGR